MDDSLAIGGTSLKEAEHSNSLIIGSQKFENESANSEPLFISKGRLDEEFRSPDEDEEEPRTLKRQLSDAFLPGESKENNDEGAISELLRMSKQKSNNVEIKEDQLIIGRLPKRTQVKESSKEEPPKRSKRPNVSPTKLAQEKTTALALHKVQESEEDQLLIENKDTENKEMLTGFQKIVILIILGVLICTLIGAIITFANSNSAADTREDLEVKKKELKLINKKLIDDISQIEKDITAIEGKIINLNKEIMEEDESLKKLMVIYEKNAKKLKILKYVKIGLQIGTGTTAALSLTAGSTFLYQYIQAKRITERNKELVDIMNTIYSKMSELVIWYEHYYTYFEKAYMKIVKNGLVHEIKGEYIRSLLYPISNGFDPDKLFKYIEGQEMTTVTVTTKKDWIIAGFLSAPWIENESIKDEKALLFAISRGEETILPKDNAINAAQFINNGDKAYLMFGKGDVEFHKEFKGKSRAGTVYKPLNNKIDVERFYANETNFNMSSILIHKYKWKSLHINSD